MLIDNCTWISAPAALQPLAVNHKLDALDSLIGKRNLRPQANGVNWRAYCRQTEGRAPSRPLAWRGGHDGAWPSRLPYRHSQYLV